VEWLEKLLAGLTNLTWVSSSQSYRIAGPPRTFSSAETTISRGRLCSFSHKDQEQAALDKEVEDASRRRMPETMHVLVEMIDELEEESRPV